VCEFIWKELGIPSVAHVTCRGAAAELLHGVIQGLLARGVRNIVALRGDAPELLNAEAMTTTAVASPSQFNYASDLVRWARAQYPEVGVAVASYPETHPEAVSEADDVARLQEKVALGADVAVSQFFLDAQRYLAFRDRVEAAGGLARGCRMVPGIVIVNSYTGLQRMIRLSGNTTHVPPAVAAELERLRDDQPELQAYGVKLATCMCRTLYDAGERFFHLYTLNLTAPVTRLIAALTWAAQPEDVLSLPSQSMKGTPTQEQHQQQT
jgi:methylenetetrahydrofolate reductase (NADPH)